MRTDCKLTYDHLRLLSLIAESEHVLVFDLEVQELIELGLVDDYAGVLKVTRLGRATLKLFAELKAA